jgi:ligand-binding SRPBCC domain-containing protein
MPKIELVTLINAPIGRCFDLARSIDLHMESTKQTGEKAIAGKTSGLIGMGESVTWRARHFGVWQTLTTKITGFEYPVFFADEMVTGAFKSFRHEHHFRNVHGKTEMTDIFAFKSPFGFMGKLADTLVLTAYMKKLLEKRNQVIKSKAEN